MLQYAIWVLCVALLWIKSCFTAWGDTEVGVRNSTDEAVQKMYIVKIDLASEFILKAASCLYLTVKC